MEDFRYSRLLYGSTPLISRLDGGGPADWPDVVGAIEGLRRFDDVEIASTLLGLNRPAPLSAPLISLTGGPVGLLGPPPPASAPGEFGKRAFDAFPTPQQLLPVMPVTAANKGSVWDGEWLLWAKVTVDG